MRYGEKGKATITIDGKTHEILVTELNACIDPRGLGAYVINGYKEIVLRGYMKLAEDKCEEEKALKAYNTSAGDIEKIAFSEFLEKISKGKVRNTIEPYNKLNNDNTYCRNIVKVGPLTEEYLKDQLIEQLEEVDQIEELTPQVVQDAAVRSLDNFGIPKYLVELEKDLFALMCTDSDTIGIRKLDENNGALFLYAPHRCGLIKVIKKERYQEVDSNSIKLEASKQGDTITFIKPAQGIDFIETKITIDSKCECGSDKAGIGGHSTWCPKFEGGSNDNI